LLTFEDDEDPSGQLQELLEFLEDTEAYLARKSGDTLDEDDSAKESSDDDDLEQDVDEEGRNVSF
jgi:hypothetical protein